LGGCGIVICYKNKRDRRLFFRRSLTVLNENRPWDCPIPWRFNEENAYPYYTELV
jgi:hypothetical protein